VSLRTCSTACDVSTARRCSYGRSTTPTSDPSGTPPVTHKRYNAAVTLRHTYLFALAVLVVAFVALYPYLGSMGMCDFGECPYAAQSSSHTSSAGLASVCVSAVLSALPAVLAFGLSRGRRLPAADSRPTELYLSPDRPPPRSFLSW
jgi:hypothetical protein